MATVVPRQRLERRNRALDILGGLPEVEQEGEQHVAFRIRRRTFAWLVDDHHDDGRLAVHLRPLHGDQTVLVAADPEGRFVPPYLGTRGWVGVHLDVDVVDWDAVEGLALESFLRIAPRRLAAQLGH